jgi:hypothetical protein
LGSAAAINATQRFPRRIPHAQIPTRTQTDEFSIVSRSLETNAPNFGISTHMKRLILTTISLALCGCTPNSKTPDQIRQDAANATASASRDAAVAAQDAKAAVQGIQDGLHSIKPLNINTASEADLESLPGIDPVTAGKIMAHRPYASPAEMVDHHAISRAEYDRIANKVVAQ